MQIRAPSSIRRCMNMPRKSDTLKPGKSADRGNVMRAVTRILAFAGLAIVLATNAAAQRGPALCKKKGSCLEVTRGSVCVPVIYRCVSPKDPNRQVPLENCRRGCDAQGNCAGVLRGVSRFPGFIPPKPVPIAPSQNAVVDGSVGKEVVGERDTAPLIFEWGVPSLRLPIRWGAIGVVPAMISHSQICVYQPNKKAQCEGPLSREAQGIVRYYAGCRLNKFTPAGGGLMTGSNRFRPEFGADVRGVRSVLRLEWMVRFCNVDACGAWSDPRSIYWVPPPILRNPVTRSATLVQFSIEYVGKPNNAPDHFPLLCFGTPGETCGTAEARSPTSDPYVQKGEFRVAQWPPNAPVWNIDPQVTAFSPARPPAGAKTVHWTAATCISVPGRPRPACVYNHSVRSFTFQ